MSNSEVMRYVRYLQNSLASDSLPDAHDQVKMAEWTRSNLSRLQNISSNWPLALSEQAICDFTESIVAYQPASEFQTAASAMIFEPIIEEIATIASELGINLSEKIIVANLPDVAIGPLSRPSIETPMIFSGLGTSAFCNYWSKFYSILFAGLKENEPPNSAEVSALEALESMPKLIAKATMLGVYYAFSGTVLGFGTIQEPTIAFGHRMELLMAMEVFVLAHEFAHLYLEEKHPELQGCTDPEKILWLELECDKIGFALARNYGAKHDNWSAYTGAGAFLFFEAVKISYFARDLRSLIKPEPDGHPSPEERQSRLFSFAINSAHPEQIAAVEYYLHDLQKISGVFSSTIRSELEGVLKETD